MNANPDISEQELDEKLKFFTERFVQLKSEIAKAVVGHEQLVTDTLVAIFSRGHVLLEGVPGLGKTHLVKVLSSALGLTFGRVQCTPDLMPADILGTHIIGEDASGRRAMRFEKGPVFRHLLLVDEINRATPKTQSALLEVMQEHTVTAGGEKFQMPEPFFVLATQKPREMEGTNPLPEAQLDRFFFKLNVTFPELDELVNISKQTTGIAPPSLNEVMDGDQMLQMQTLLNHVPAADPITRYAASLVLATHGQVSGDQADDLKRYIAYGSSPRGLQALIRAARVYCLLDGRTAVAVQDVQRAARPALRHRMILNFEGQAESVDVDALIDRLLSAVPTPGAVAA
ncbi:MAG: MoxR family ATPase [Phycisphaeraceae bacterium]|nr:MoxR family ATPase [Phycisphaeraceae bacterium]